MLAEGVPMKWIKRLGLILAGLVVATVVAEFTLALFWPQPTMNRLRSQWPAIYRPSRTMPYELIPNARSQIVDPTGEFDTKVSINSLGHRGPEFSIDKPDGVTRVLAIGDSFTFGWGVEDDEPYPRQLERLLRAKPGLGKVEVINAGFAACFYPDTYYVYLRDRGLAWKPDVVVVGFYLGNDIYEFGMDTWNAWQPRLPGALPGGVRMLHKHVEDGYLVSNERDPRYATPILRNSHLAQAYYSLKEEQPRPRSELFNRFIYRNDYPPATRAHVRDVRRLFAEMHRMTAERGIPLVVMIIPAREQVHPLDDAEFKSIAQDLTRPNREFGAYFAQKGIRHFDLLEPFREASKVKRYYFHHDNHWNLDGHRFAAERLAAVVEPLLAPAAK